jgi:hypothetical protein
LLRICCNKSDYSALYLTKLIKLMFTSGRIIFVIIFVVIFIAGLVWSYRKERLVIKTHFKRSYLILFSIIFFLTILFFIVKIRKFL